MLKIFFSKYKPDLGIIKIVSGLLLVIMLVIIHLSNPSFFPELWTLLVSGDIQHTTEYLRSFNEWAVLVTFFIMLFTSTIGFPPAMIFTTAAAILWGIIPSLLLSCVAETIGVTIAFVLMRHFFRDSAVKIIQKSPALSKLDRASGHKGFMFMLIARMVPYFPSALLNAMGALSSLSLRDYVVASFIGKFPSTGIEAVIGYDLMTGAEDYTRIIFVIIFALLLIVGAWVYEKRVLKL